MRLASVILALSIVALAAGCNSVTPADAVRLMEDSNSADARREGIADLASQFDFARVPPYTSRYQQIAKTDSDYTVRAMAVRALNICRDRSAVPIFIAALDSDHAAVRLEGAKALVNVPDQLAVPALLRLVRGVRKTTIEGHDAFSPEDRDVRIAAVDALRRYPSLNVELTDIVDGRSETQQYTTLGVERALVGYLGENEFAIAWQARQSLIALTGTDLQYDEGAWLQYLVKAGS